VKSARNEAQKEIEEYRQAKEEEFKKFEKEVSSLFTLPTTPVLTSPSAHERQQASRRGCE